MKPGSGELLGWALYWSRREQDAPYQREQRQEPPTESANDLLARTFVLVIADDSTAAALLAWLWLFAATEAA